MITAAKRRVFIPLLMLAMLPTACVGARSAYVPPTPPPESAARDLVSQVVQLALNHDFDRLCALGTPECKYVLDNTGTDTVPIAAPRIVSVTTVPNQQTSPGTWTPGGVLFLLCGLDGNARPYHSQMLVFENQQGTGLAAMEPVFWGSLNIGSTVAEPTPSVGNRVWQDCPSWRYEGSLHGQRARIGSKRPPDKPRPASERAGFAVGWELGACDRVLGLILVRV